MSSHQRPVVVEPKAGVEPAERKTPFGDHSDELAAGFCVELGCTLPHRAPNVFGRVCKRQRHRPCTGDAAVSEGPECPFTNGGYRVVEQRDERCGCSISWDCLQRGHGGEAGARARIAVCDAGDRGGGPLGGKLGERFEDSLLAALAGVIARRFRKSVDQWCDGSLAKRDESVDHRLGVEPTGIIQGLDQGRNRLVAVGCVRRGQGECGGATDLGRGIVESPGKRFLRHRKVSSAEQRRCGCSSGNQVGGFVWIGISGSCKLGGELRFGFDAKTHQRRHRAITRKVVVEAGDEHRDSPLFVQLTECPGNLRPGTYCKGSKQCFYGSWIVRPRREVCCDAVGDGILRKGERCWNLALGDILKSSDKSRPRVRAPNRRESIGGETPVLENRLRFFPNHRLELSDGLGSGPNDVEKYASTIVEVPQAYDQMMQFVHGMRPTPLRVVLVENCT